MEIQFKNSNNEEKTTISPKIIFFPCDS